MTIRRNRLNVLITNFQPVGRTYPHPLSHTVGEHRQQFTGLGVEKLDQSHPAPAGQGYFNPSPPAFHLRMGDDVRIDPQCQDGMARPGPTHGLEPIIGSLVSTGKQVVGRVLSRPKSSYNASSTAMHAGIVRTCSISSLLNISMEFLPLAWNFPLPKTHCRCIRSFIAVIGFLSTYYKIFYKIFDFP